MTLGDRVVVLLGGEVQQIGTPEELYARPANLFVAGFIGSPAMNFFPASMTDVGVRLPFGEVTLTQEVHDLLARHNTPTNVIIGIRPEHLEDAAVLDSYARISATTFEVTVDMVESLGADKYVHFKTEGAGAKSAQLAELAAESGAGENEFVARVSTASRAKQGDTIQLAFDSSKLVIFDADSGKNLTLPDAPAATAPPPPPAAESDSPAPEPTPPPAE
jgi:multiple sugar transport system ATP-binding protein